MKTHSATAPGASAVSGQAAGPSDVVVEVDGKFPEEVALLKALVATATEDKSQKPQELEIQEAEEETPGEAVVVSALPGAPVLPAQPTDTSLVPAVPLVSSVPTVPAGQVATPVPNEIYETDGSNETDVPTARTLPTVPQAMPQANDLPGAPPQNSQMPAALPNAPEADLPTIGRSILEAFGVIKKEETAIPSTPAPDAESTAPNLGMEILRSFEALGRTSESAAPRTDAALALPKLVSLVADRILVSDPLHNQNPEIRIKLADNILPNTEIRIWREQGQLNVEFVSTDASSIRTLNEAAPALSQRLGERLHMGTSIQVTDGQGQTASSDTPQDGRSRQQYVPQEPEQEG